MTTYSSKMEHGTRRKKKGNDTSINDMGTNKVLTANESGKKETIEFKESGRKDKKAVKGVER